MSRFNLLIVLLLVVTGCDSTADAEDDSLAPGDVVARIDGAEFESTFATATVQSDYLAVGASTTSGSVATALAFTLYPFTGPGDYTLDHGRTASNALVTVTGGSESSAYSTALNGGGTVDVTEVTAGDVQGTFSFTAQNEAGEVVQVTGGRFHVRLTQEAGASKASPEAVALQALRR